MTARITGSGVAGRTMSSLTRALPMNEAKDLGRSFQRALQRLTGQANRAVNDRPVKPVVPLAQQDGQVAPATLLPAPPQPALPLARKPQPSMVPPAAMPAAMPAPLSAETRPSAPLSPSKDKEVSASPGLQSPPPLPAQQATAAPELPAAAPQDAEFSAQLARLDAALPASARTEVHLPGDQFAVRHVTVEQAQTGLSLTMDMRDGRQGDDALDDLLKRLRARGITAQIALRDDSDAA